MFRSSDLQTFLEYMQDSNILSCVCSSCLCVWLSFPGVRMSSYKSQQNYHFVCYIIRAGHHALQDSSLFSPYVQHQLVTTLLEGAYNSNDPDLALSLATVRSQMAHELYGPGVQHAAALGELVNAQLFKCEKPSAIKQVCSLLVRSAIALLQSLYAFAGFCYKQGSQAKLETSDKTDTIKQQVYFVREII